MNDPKVSVLTSVYNSAEFIRPAVESVLNQTFVDFEWIIINDASTDDSIEIIESYNDPRIKIFHNEKNLGLAASLNKGLGLCRGEYIARMDTDDVCYRNRFEQQVKFMDAHPEITIAGSWVNLTGERKGIWKTPLTHDEVKCKLLFNSAIAHPTVIMRKSEMEKYKFRYDENLRRIQDYDLWVRASEKVKLSNIPEVLLDYRIDDQAKTSEVVQRANVVIYSIRQSQLNKLEIKLTETEADSLHYISTNRFEKVNVAVINSVFKNILSANKTHKVYNQRILAWYIGRIWLRLTMKRPLTLFSASPLMISTAIRSCLN